jgi:hypothetical protein
MKGHRLAQTAEGRARRSAHGGHGPEHGHRAERPRSSGRRSNHQPQWCGEYDHTDQALRGDLPTGGTQPTSTFTPDQFKGKFATPPASDQGLCNAVHPVGAAIGGTGGTAPGPTNYGNKDDYIPHHEPFQYYASTANPHHLPPASLSAIGTDTQSYVNGVPQFDTANHQYDISNFNSLVGAIAHHSGRVGRPLVAGPRA